MPFVYYRNSEVSPESQSLIKGLLQLKTDRRLTATQVRDRIELIFASNPVLRSTDQCVPKMKCDEKKPTMAKVKVCTYTMFYIIPAINQLFF